MTDFFISYSFSDLFFSFQSWGLGRTYIKHKVININTILPHRQVITWKECIKSAENLFISNRVKCQYYKALITNSITNIFLVVWMDSDTRLNHENEGSMIHQTICIHHGVTFHNTSQSTYCHKNISTSHAASYLMSKDIILSDDLHHCFTQFCMMTCSAMLTTISIFHELGSTCFSLVYYN